MRTGSQQAVVIVKPEHPVQARIPRRMNNVRIVLHAGGTAYLQNIKPRRRHGADVGLQRIHDGERPVARAYATGGQTGNAAGQRGIALVGGEIGARLPKCGEALDDRPEYIPVLPPLGIKTMEAEVRRSFFPNRA